MKPKPKTRPNLSQLPGSLTILLAMKISDKRIYMTMADPKFTLQPMRHFHMLALFLHL